MGNPDHRRTGRRDAGFSIIEALIAAAILLIIALGLLPLFTRSISDNVSGNDATQATNGSRTRSKSCCRCRSTTSGWWCRPARPRVRRKIISHAASPTRDRHL